ncbi:MAG: hypothetical protein U0930_16990 [Pirellulales bacterium]
MERAVVEGTRLFWLKSLNSDGKLMIIDRDPAAVVRLSEMFKPPVEVIQGSYDQALFLEQQQWPKVNGILLILD